MSNLGYAIYEEYKYGGETRYKPIGDIFPDGSHTGYIYIYPTYKCAQLEAQKLHYMKTVIKKVFVKILNKDD